MSRLPSDRETKLGAVRSSRSLHGRREGCLRMPTLAAVSRDPLEAQIARAHDEVVVEESAQACFRPGPRNRIAKVWLTGLWPRPIRFVRLILLLGVPIELRSLPAVQEFIARYPGQALGGTYEGFPLWLRLNHVFNLFLMAF